MEYAVVKPKPDGTAVTVPSTILAKETEKKAAEIGQKIGAKVLSARRKPPPPQPTAVARTGKNGGLIAGVVVAVGLLIVIAAVGVWYFRYDRFPYLSLVASVSLWCSMHIFL